MFEESRGSATVVASGMSCPRRLGALGAAATLLALSAVAALAPSRASADPQPTIFVGGEGNFASYGYGGVSLPVWNGFGVRGVGFGGGYSYRGGPTGHVHADFGGGSFSALYQMDLSDTWLNLGVGVQYMDTHLSPFDHSNRRHGGQAEPLISADGGHVVGPWRVDGYASYGTRIEDYNVRASLTHALAPGWRAGVEGDFEGDPTYDQQGGGPIVAFQLDPKSEIQVAGGVSHQSGRNTGGFVRVGVSHSF